MFVFCPVQRYTASNGSGRRFEFCCLHHIVTSPNRKVRACSFSARFGGTPPPTGQVTDSSSVVSTTLKQARTERFGLVRFLLGSAVHRLQRVRTQIRVLLSSPKERHLLFADVFLLGFRSRWSLHPLVIIMLGGNEFRLRRGFALQNARTAPRPAAHLPREGEKAPLDPAAAGLGPLPHVREGEKRQGTRPQAVSLVLYSGDG